MTLVSSGVVIAWLNNHAKDYIRLGESTIEIRDYGYTNPDMLDQMIYDLGEYLTEK
jgi:hypothetical protein